MDGGKEPRAKFSHLNSHRKHKATPADSEKQVPEPNLEQLVHATSTHEEVCELHSGSPSWSTGAGGMGDSTGHAGKAGERDPLRAERKRLLAVGGHRALDTRLSKQNSGQEIWGSAPTVHLYPVALMAGRELENLFQSLWTLDTTCLLVRLCVDCDLLLTQAGLTEHPTPELLWTAASSPSPT